MIWHGQAKNNFDLKDLQKFDIILTRSVQASFDSSSSSPSSLTISFLQLRNSLVSVRQANQGIPEEGSDSEAGQSHALVRMASSCCESFSSSIDAKRNETRIVLLTLAWLRFSLQLDEAHNIKVR